MAELCPLREHILHKRTVFFQALPKLPPPCVLQKQLKLITTMIRVIIVIIILVLLVILVLKMTKKYTHNMVLMSRYKGQLHGGKKGQKNWASPLPPFRAMPERKHLFAEGVH